MKGAHTGWHMADTVFKTLEKFDLTKRLFCITTDNASNNGRMRKDLEAMIESTADWSSEATKIPCMAHVIQLVVKAMLKAFNIEPGEGLSDTTTSDDLAHDRRNIREIFRDDGSVVTAIQKVRR